MNNNTKHHLFFVGAMNITLFIFYANTVTQLFDFWSNSYGYSHGVLLFPLLLGVYFYELYKSPKLDFSLLNVVGLCCVLGLGFVWFTADLLNVQFIEFFTFWCILILLNLFLTSSKLKNSIHLWPLLLMIFVLPLWDFLSEILRTIETPMVVFALQASLINATRDGFLIYVPAGTFLVENACSGFNQFIVSVPLAILYSYTRKLNFVAGCKFVLLLLLLAIFFNTLRIYIIVVAGQLSHMQTSLLTNHEYLAWLIYGIGVFILFFIADRRLKPTNKLATNISKLEVNLAAIYKTHTSKFVVVALIFALGPLLSLAYPLFKNNSLINMAQLVDKLYWKEMDSTSKFQPVFPEGDRLYQHKLENIFGDNVTLYINYFVNQEQGREAVNDVNSLVRKEDKLIAEKQSVIELPDSKTGSALKVNEFIVRLQSGEIYLVWQWYFTNGKHLNRAMSARLNNIRAIIKNEPAISNIVLLKQLYADVRIDEKKAHDVMRSFVVDNIDILTMQLR